MDDITRLRLQRGLIPRAEPVPRIGSRSHVLQVFVPTVADWQWWTAWRGTEEEMTELKAIQERMHPDRSYRVQEAAATRRKRPTKGWSVKDADHVPVHSNVLLKRTPEEIHPSMNSVRSAFGLTPVTARHGVITHRYWGKDGSYLVRLVGTRTTIGVTRDDFHYPVPEGVIALDPARSR